ncbi:hypothetical protein NW762_006087 [Fusarium torreyae]|uniref:Uncharacterized protein n=1 Tax=Fusarium torreyae TaxID=1237075 RepID=A0A9W8VER1_9HYPO|nr:hypothetical protein NW762_006087 [Fusarium torreyae]
MPLSGKADEPSSLRNVNPVLSKRLEIAAGEDTNVGSVLKKAIESAPLFKKKPFGIFKTFDKGLLGRYDTTTHLVAAPGDEGYLAVNIASFAAEQRCVILAAIPQPLVQRHGLNSRRRLLHFVERSLDKILGMNLSPNPSDGYDNNSPREAYPSHQDPPRSKSQHVPTTYQPAQRGKMSVAPIAQPQGIYGVNKHYEHREMVVASFSGEQDIQGGLTTAKETNKTFWPVDDTTERILSSEFLSQSHLATSRPMHEQLDHETRILTLNDFDYGLQNDIHTPHAVQESVWDATWAQDPTHQGLSAHLPPTPLVPLLSRQPPPPSSLPPPQSPYFYLPAHPAYPSATYHPTRTLSRRVAKDQNFRGVN